MIVLLNDILEIALQMLLNDVEIEIKMPLSSQLQPSIWRSSSSPKEGKRAKFNDDILNLVSPSLIIKWFVIILHMVARKRHNSCESSRMIQLNRITIAFWVKWNWLSKQFDSAILWDKFLSYLIWVDLQNENLTRRKIQYGCINTRDTRQKEKQRNWKYKDEFN